VPRDAPPQPGIPSFERGGRGWRPHPAFLDEPAAPHDALARLRRRTRRYGAGSQLYCPGDAADEVYALEAGWAFSHQTLPDGRRQITAIHLPGDTFGLQPDPAGPRRDGVDALTEVRVCVFDRQALAVLCESDGALAWRAARALARESARLAERLVSVGRRSAVERLAVLVLELYARAASRGLARDGVCPWPLTQAQLGDLLGLGAVHVNRRLQELRARGYAVVGAGELRVLDHAGLARLGGFDPHSPLPEPWP